MYSPQVYYKEGFIENNSLIMLNDNDTNDSILIDVLNLPINDLCKRNPKIIERVNKNTICIYKYAYVETDTNIDFIKLKEILEKVDKFVYDKFKNDNTFVRFDLTDSTTTQLFAYYNLLTFPYEELHDLYSTIKNVFYNNYKHFYNTDTINEKYCIQCWFNINKETKYIDWHSHWNAKFKAWHGVIYIDAETSCTSYRIGDYKQIDLQLKNSSIVLSPSINDTHKSSPWNKDTNRITIAFDIAPLKHIDQSHINHWIPI